MTLIILCTVSKTTINPVFDELSLNSVTISAHCPWSIGLIFGDVNLPE